MKHPAPRTARLALMRKGQQMPEDRPDRTEAIGSRGPVVLLIEDERSIADPFARAQRRHRELLDRGLEIPLGDVLAEQLERDHRDSTRTDSPLTRPDDAVVIDTTHQPPDAVVARMEAEVRRRCPTART